MEAFEKILVIRGGAIGDFIVTLPVLAALRNKFPSSHVELLAIPSIARVAIELSLAEKIRDLNSLSFTPLFSPNATCSSEASAWLASFDLIISYAHDPERIFETNLRTHSNAQIIKGPHRPIEPSSKHASIQLIEPLRDLVTQPFDVHCSMFNVQRSPSNLIAIHPGSGSRHKNWPVQTWRDFLQHLVSVTDDSFLVIGGEAERDYLPFLAEVIPATRRRMAIDLPLAELAGQLKTCRAFVGHDSGITHLAAVLGLDCIVLWGPTDESVWHPLSPNINLLKHPDGLSFLPVEQVVNALNSLLVAA